MHRPKQVASDIFFFFFTEPVPDIAGCPLLLPALSAVAYSWSAGSKISKSVDKGNASLHLPTQSCLAVPEPLRSTLFSHTLTFTLEVNPRDDERGRRVRLSLGAFLPQEEEEEEDIE